MNTSFTLRGAVLAALLAGVSMNVAASPTVTSGKLKVYVENNTSTDVWVGDTEYCSENGWTKKITPQETKELWSKSTKNSKDGNKIFYVCAGQGSATTSKIEFNWLFKYYSTTILSGKVHGKLQAVDTSDYADYYMLNQSLPKSGEWTGMGKSKSITYTLDN